MLDGAMVKRVELLRSQRVKIGQGQVAVEDPL